MANPDWIVHKFGGTSVGSAERIVHVAGLIRKACSEGCNLAIVVSAMSGVTDRILKLTCLAEIQAPEFAEHLESLRQLHRRTAASLLPEGDSNALSNAIEADLSNLCEILRSVYLLRECSDRARDFAAGLGEVWSAQILTALLNHMGIPCHWLDARKILVVEHVQPNVNVLWAESLANLNWFLENLQIPTNGFPKVVICTGFIAKTRSGVATTLGRNGSDYSASIFGNLLDAREVVIWTDVDGVMSADPNKVPEAVLVPELTYREAIELAYFGAKVLHPGTMTPAIAKSLPILIKNTFKPELPGSIVRCCAPVDPRHPVKGFATIEPISLLNMEGTGMMGVPGIAGRLFDALHAENISVVMISQASSEHSICFAVPAAQGATAKAAAETAFAAELLHGRVQTVELTESCAILAAVGEGMTGTIGISARFFRALGEAGVNIRAIAQGSSERNISVVIDSKQSIKALRSVHAGFYLSRQTISIGIAGLGHVGGTLLDQIGRRQRRLQEEFQIDLRIRGIINSKKMLLHERGLEAGSWRESFEGVTIGADLDAFIDHIQTDSIPHAAIIDCTPSGVLPARYRELFKRGFNIITPNKVAGSSPIEDYQRIHDAAREHNRHFLYETTVCAGLPVIGTLHDFVQTGDEIIRIEGMFSGSLSFIFSRIGAGKSFKEALREAMDLGFTETDPRDDLSGRDVARKVVILAREAGLKLDLDQIPTSNLVPNELRTVSRQTFLNSLDTLEDSMADLFAENSKDGHEPRYLGIIDPKGVSRAGVVPVPRDSLFARATGGDNVVSFRTRRYDAHPLVVTGPGAGPEVTAAGVFADLLRLCAYIGGNR